MQKTIIRVEHLTKIFPEIIAVDDISFDIYAGEIYSLLGPNGAGKTTTISMLSTLIKPSSGDATVAEHSILKDPISVRKTIGVVPQEIALYDSLTAQENLAFWGKMYDLYGKKLSQQSEKILHQVGLWDRRKDKVDTFSGGMKRRLNIGVGLLHNPKVLFMDEPTVGIDPQSRRNILDAVLDLNKNGMTIIYTTHYMEEAQELSDRVGIIDHGKLIANGTQDELTKMVGEHAALRLHVSETQSAETLAKQLEKQSFCIKASATDHQVLLMVDDPEKVLPSVITTCNEFNYRIRSVDIEEPNLESVFLHLTGRALRD
ncbi:MAG: ATP-binding cassette domain-containing protein [Anaerolineaceae bacterium]|nr:ATP-binding cassette domain-containing protein [Anaerolineaceae bacterium]